MLDIAQWLDSFHSLVWVALIVICLQFVVAGALISLAYYIVSKDKLRLELFSRRLSVFEGIQEILTDYIVREHIGPEELRRYVSVTSEAPFILGQDVVAHLNEIRSRFIVLVVWGQLPDRNNLPASEREKAEMAERWIKDHIDSDTLQKLFVKEMGLFFSRREWERPRTLRTTSA